MDAFTENILARARERQKLLEGYSQESAIPLRENNKIAVSEPNLNEFKPLPRKEVASDSNIPSKLKNFGGSAKENVSEGFLVPLKGMESKEIKSDTDITKTSRPNPIKVSSDMPGSPSPKAKTLNIQRDNFNMEIKLTSLENVRVQVEIEEHTDNEDENDENTNHSNKITVEDKTSDNGSDAGSQVSSDGGLREESKNRLKRLGRLYAGGEEADISSPIHRTEARFYQELERTSNKSGKDDSEMPAAASKAKKGLSKLAALADEINHWEDDMSHPKPLEKKATSPRRAWKPQAPQPPTIEKSPQKSPKKTKAPSPPVSKSSSESSCTSESSQEDSTAKQVTPGSPRHDPHKFLAASPRAARVPPGSPRREVSPTKGSVGSPTKFRGEGGPQCVGVTPKKVNWDQTVLDTLDNQAKPKVHKSTAQIEVKSTPIVEEVDDPEAKNLKKEEQAGVTKPSARSEAIARRAAMFESNKTVETPVSKPSGKDPAFLSLSERKALFEKNKGEALVPKAAFGMSAPVKVDSTMKACESKLIGASKSNESIKIASKSNESIKSASNSNESIKSLSEKKENIEKSTKILEKPPLANEKSSKVKNYGPKPPPVAQKPTTSPIAVVHQSGGIASTVAALLEKKSTISEEQIFAQAKSERQKEIEMLLNRFNKNKGISDKDEQNRIEELSYSSDEDETDETTAMIKKKDRPASIVSAASTNEQSRKSAEKRKSGGSRLSCDSDHPQVVSALEDVKRIKVSPPKAGRLYPCLSDIEATTGEDTRTPSPDDADLEESSLNDSQCDSDDPNTSFGRDILQAVVKNQQSPKKTIVYRESTGSEASSIMGELDEILDEYDDDDEYSSSGPTPPKQGRHHLSPESKQARPSNSFHYKSFQSPTKNTPTNKCQQSNFQSPMKAVNADSSRPSMELPLVVDGGNVLPLTHTVSFYRKQQNEHSQTPVKKVVMQPLIQEDERETINDEEVKQKIKELQEEVNKQQNIIAQTSQALNLCSSTPEFSGSTEQVEAERVLLLASHRRQAALHEQQRLRVEGTLRPKSSHSQNLPLEKGTLTISDIVLPLKQKYVTALAAAGGKGHHVVCLIKCGEQVVSTKLVSTVASSSKNPDVDLYVPGSVTLKDIYSDFTVAFEVYCLQAQEECLPHEVKYHINKKGSKGNITPKKSKQDSKLSRPPKESPAGPQAVRTSSFALMGYVVFSVQAVNRKVWSLNNTPPMSPLEGNVHMKISCELAVSVEHRGFLTMFEDVSGFGAWHRRWCLLKGDTLSYWKYPDNEKKMPPIDTIDLNTCITKTVAPVSREICARMHTFLLERERDALPLDKDSLVMEKKGDKTVIRHLLSADTKEERIEWCQKLNSSLTALKLWGTTQQFPKNNPEFFKKWLMAVNPPNWRKLANHQIYDKFLVCDDHFVENDFVKNTKRGLKVNAVPSTNLAELGKNNILFLGYLDKDALSKTNGQGEERNLIKIPAANNVNFIKFSIKKK